MLSMFLLLLVNWSGADSWSSAADTWYTGTDQWSGRHYSSANICAHTVYCVIYDKYMCRHHILRYIPQIYESRQYATSYMNNMCMCRDQYNVHTSAEWLRSLCVTIRFPILVFISYFFIFLWFSLYIHITFENTFWYLLPKQRALLRGSDIT